MKKIYALVAGLAFVGGVSAQIVTKDLTDHTAGAFGGITQQKFPANAAFSYTGDGGYISGTSKLTYQDGSTATVFQVAQLFDENDGVFDGIVNEVSFAAALKVGTTGAVKIAVQEVGSFVNAGTTYYYPDAIISSKDITLADIDTAQTALNVIGTAPAYTGAYNVKATFATPGIIPANKKFFVTITLPQTAGDTLAISHTFSSTDYPNFPTNLWDYAYTGNHSGVVYGTTLGVDDIFASYKELGFQTPPTFANLIYAHIASGGVGTLELAGNNVKVYPNPANDVLNVEVDGAEVSVINIYSLDGRVVSSNNANASVVNVNISSLVEGTYIYEIVAENGATFKSKFVKK